MSTAFTALRLVLLTIALAATRAYDVVLDPGGCTPQEELSSSATLVECEALALAGWTLDDLELIELNEAFAAQSLGVIRSLGLDETKVNVNGGAIALGHPLGCSGARILTTLIHAMHASGARRGLATLCVGVGQGVSTLVEAIDG